MTKQQIITAIHARNILKAYAGVPGMSWFKVVELAAAALGKRFNEIAEYISEVDYALATYEKGQVSGQ